MKNYTDPSAPIFSGVYANTPKADFNGNIKVISYNINFGENVSGAVAELKEIEDLKEADIILLQEMDEVGTDKIARSLGYNYVYIPASIHTRHRKNFGNAILSKWSIREPQKVLLPHANPKDRQRRVATKAIVDITGREVLAISVHTETYWLLRSHRHKQFQEIINRIDPDFEHVIIGGDFNTITSGGVADLDRIFARINMPRATQGVGYTLKYGPLTIPFDHVYVKGFKVISAGKSTATFASDHHPIWVNLGFE